MKEIKEGHDGPRAREQNVQYTFSTPTCSIHIFLYMTVATEPSGRHTTEYEFIVLEINDSRHRNHLGYFTTIQEIRRTDDRQAVSQSVLGSIPPVSSCSAEHMQCF